MSFPRRGSVEGHSSLLFLIINYIVERSVLSRVSSLTARHIYSLLKRNIRHTTTAMQLYCVQ